MISSVCYALVFAVESFISFYYFDFVFERKFSLRIIAPCFAVSALIQYAVSLAGVPTLNALGFLVCNCLICCICCKSRIKSALFSCFVLMLLMIASELIVIYGFSVIYNTTVSANIKNEYVLLYQSIITKLFYFILVHLLIRISSKADCAGINRFSLPLAILPVSSVLIIDYSFRLCVRYQTESLFKIALTESVMLLFTNIVVYYIHELSLRLQAENSRMFLEKQKRECDISYFDLLKKQNENSKLLIHDITKHLNTIMLLSRGVNPEIEGYVKSLADDFEIFNPVEYSKNQIVNLITNRYYSICRERGITFVADVREADFGLMEEYEITALLENLLENAVEAASPSKEKFIDFSIVTRNIGFTMIKIINSSDREPKMQNGLFLTNKSDSLYHGTGTKSVRRIAEKYNGSYETSYNEKNKTFTSLVGIADKDKAIR